MFTMFRYIHIFLYLDCLTLSICTLVQQKFPSGKILCWLLPFPLSTFLVLVLIMHNPSPTLFPSPFSSATPFPSLSPWPNAKISLCSHIILLVTWCCCYVSHFLHVLNEPRSLHLSACLRFLCIDDRGLVDAVVHQESMDLLLIV